MKVYCFKVIIFLSVTHYKLDHSLCEDELDRVRDKDNKRTGIANDQSSTCVKGNTRCRCENQPDGLGTALKCREAGLTSFPNIILSKQEIVVIEINENKISRLTAGMFEGFRNLNEISMQNNEIKTIEKYTFRNLNELITLNLEGNQISYLTAGIFDEMRNSDLLLVNKNETINNVAKNASEDGSKTRDLTNNEIIALNEGMLHNLQRLEVLYSGENVTEPIEYHALNGLGFLRYLVKNKATKLTNRILEESNNSAAQPVSDNEVDIVRNDTLKKPFKLRDLYLDGKRIASFITEMMENSPGLRVLNLGNNQINTIENHVFKKCDKLYYLNLAYNKISEFTAEKFNGLSALQTLDLTANKIETLEKRVFKELPSLQELYLGCNKITKLTAGTFATSQRLRILNLTSNEIDVIENQAFVGLNKLHKLYLSHNKILRLKAGMFDGLINLFELELQENDIETIEYHTLGGLMKLLQLNLANNSITWKGANLLRNNTKLEKLITDEYRLCCLTNITKCHPRTHELSSCQDLLQDTVLRIGITMVGVAAIFANTFVIVFRTRYSEYYTDQINSLLVRNLAISDSFMGIYLIIIAVADNVYREDYNEHDFEWRSSTWCHLAGVMSTFSSSLTAFTLMIITVERLWVVTSPLRARTREVRQMKILLAQAWLVATLIAVLPLRFFQIGYFENFYSRSGICLPLHISSNKPNGWHYSALVFLVLYSIAFFIIVVSYTLMFWSTTKIRRAVNVANEKSLQQMVMIFRMTLFVLADATCKIPIIVLGAKSLSGHPVLPSVYAWIVIFVAPLNAALNPILYTLSSLPMAFRFMEYLRDHEFKSPILIQFRSPVSRKSKPETADIPLVKRRSATGYDNPTSTQ